MGFRDGLRGDKRKNGSRNRRPFSYASPLREVFGTREFQPRDQDRRYPPIRELLEDGRQGLGHGSKRDETDDTNQPGMGLSNPGKQFASRPTAWYCSLYDDSVSKQDSTFKLDRSALVFDLGISSGVRNKALIGSICTV